MCKSEPQMAVDVILMIASRGLRIRGSGTVSTLTFSVPSQQTARTSTPPLPAGCSRNLAGFEPLLEVPQIFANGLRRFTAEERRDERTGLSRRRRVLQVHGELRAAPAADPIEVDRSGG